MAIDIGTLKGTITLADQFSGPLDKFAKAVGISTKSFSAIGQAAGLVGAAIATTTAAIVALGVRGADVADVQSAFDNLATAAGSTAAAMLGELQRGTLGTINNFDLMKVANKALGAGLITTADDMGTLAQGAQLLADRTGKDTKEAFELLTSAIASGRTSSLKQLGLFVDSKVATQEYASALGETTSKMSGADKAQALSAATLAELRKQLEAGGKSTADFGDNIQRGKVLFENLTDQLGVAIATSPVVGAGMKAMGDALQAAFGGNQQNTVKTITGLVNKFAIFLVDVGSVGVSAAHFISDAWNGVQFLFNTVMAGLTDALSFVNRAIAATVESAAAIPGAPAWLQDMAKTARAASDEIQIMSGSFKHQADQVLDNAAKNKVMFDAIQNGFTVTRAAMVAAQGEQALVTKSHQEMGQAAVESAKVHSDSAAKIKEAMTNLQHDISLAQTTGVTNRLLELEFAMEKEIQTARDLKDISLEQFQQMVDGIREKYDAITSKALDSSAEVLAATTKLQQDLALANTTGLENRLIEIDIAREKEIEGIQVLEEKYGEVFEEMRALVAEKYAGMRDAAIASHDSITAAANAAGFQTRAQLQETADNAGELYARMLAEGTFTYGELQKAHEAWKKAEDDLNEKSAISTMQKFELLAASASSILRSLFGKSKAAAIAAAIIDTAAAVVKSLAAYPWPWNLVPAAAALAAGMAQVSKIRSTDAGFAMGTPGTSFQDFGRESIVALHNREAVVTPAQGASVAGMVGEAIRAARRDSGGGGRFGVAIQIGPREIRDFNMREIRAGFQPA